VVPTPQASNASHVNFGPDVLAQRTDSRTDSEPDSGSESLHIPQFSAPNAGFRVTEVNRPPATRSDSSRRDATSPTPFLARSYSHDVLESKSFGSRPLIRLAVHSLPLYRHLRVPRPRPHSPDPRRAVPASSIASTSRMRSKSDDEAHTLLRWPYSS
jgi:hypothetical protein